MSADWILSALGEDAIAATEEVVASDLLTALSDRARPVPDGTFHFVSEGLEFAVFQLLDDPDSVNERRSLAGQAFDHLRVSSRTSGEQLLKTACYGVLADRTPDVARFLRTEWLEVELPDQGEWGVYVRATAVAVWLRLLRKQGWEDIDAAVEGVVLLREAQASREAPFLAAAGESQRSSAWHLVAHYHLAKAAEILATYTTQGHVAGTYDIREQLQAQFDRSITACERAEFLELYSFVKLLAAAADQMVSNSIWTVTRAVNSRVTSFVNDLVSRDRTQPVFEMLPPQRIALREHGLLGTGHRSVVVSLPTSSGKTLIAQFRILQALNQFDLERGWVAYIVPTRALVNQVSVQLRRDFEPLGINVERISPALEIDGVESEILTDQNEAGQFRVLVSTPEKLDLLLRGGWEAKIGRPLTLVVVDEAHNLAGGERGLRLELLLATINRECRNSQFLLLTPFIQNCAEIARWLSPDSSQDIGVSFDWRPNDTAVMLARPVRGSAPGEFAVSLNTVHTSRQTLDADHTVTYGPGRALGLTWSKVSNGLSNVAAVVAERLSQRGTVIAIANKVPHTWSLARTLANAPELDDVADADIDFVCAFVGSEFGADFELISCLRKGIGLHHSGLSDEVRVLTEWLAERKKLRVLVATTTIAQGVNFPVSGVVLASHQYNYGQDMPPEDFWNLAGRAGRANQAGLGIVALATTSDAKTQALKTYLQRASLSLHSTLVEMLNQTLSLGQSLELNTLFYKKEWSAFLQYLAHTYRLIGDHSVFANQVEQVLRGSFGFQEIRRSNPQRANALVAAVHRYANGLRGKPLALVDATGFSWESVSVALNGVREESLTAAMWDPGELFERRNNDLERAFGVLFRIPEIREELEQIISGRGRDGALLANVVRDWVHGASLRELADRYYIPDAAGNETDAITSTCRSIYGKMVQTASWGLAALQALTIDENVGLSESELVSVRNLPARVYYGVNSDEAINLRLLGVPRKAAQPLAEQFVSAGVSGFSDMRAALRASSPEHWRRALGDEGEIYRRAWKVLEGRE